MNPATVMPELKKFIVNSVQHLPKYGDWGTEHLIYMCAQITNGKVTGEKAHRWAGYIQGVLVSHNIVTLKQMKELNKNEFL